MSFNDGFSTKSIPVPSTAPVSGNVLVYDGTNWVAGATSGGGGGTPDVGLQNKLLISPTTPTNDENLIYTGSGGIDFPSYYIPDETPPSASSDNRWKFTKASGTTSKINWYMFNPLYGSGSFPLASVDPSIPKSSLKSCWFVIRPNTTISVSGYVFFNIYSYAAGTTPPTFYTTRWSYNIPTGVSLVSGYTYLVYALDPIRNVATANTYMPTAQRVGLRDPYDIYTDIPHIAASTITITGSDTGSAGFQNNPITGLVLSSTSLSTVVMDFNILNFGFNDGSSNNIDFTLIHSGS